ncbi:hypothetical protein GJV26_16065 [Massilia dura]|uniref:Uncharacterized protein n=1 Tax=Pseudoduganella dura TaxID=321982 RepID=A0A6I3XC48_9BURK|nr:hypothetical protein [Pseudoduganella dura]MUI13957.1 hypothetical protein [Pseudoduganella dura]GGX98829.1 hypothetical protein GCM10007386_32130 [Pseudoduganella dura]
MKHHARAARAHFAFAVLYAVPLAALLAVAPLTGRQPATLPAVFAAMLVIVHLFIGWGAWRARNWARLTTLALAFPALLAIPLGTLVAILLISYCWQAWDDRSSPSAPRGIRVAD